MRPIGLAPGDEWRIPPWETYGFHPDWVGPSQPMGEYISFDIDEMYENWRDLKGQYHYGDGSVSYDLEVGFLWYNTDSEGYTNQIADEHGIYWSGLYIDDAVVSGLRVQDEIVWSDTIIIPGPVENCDVIPVQFEWEDVPYSNYRITIESTAGCGNMEDTSEYVQILVVSDKERADEKEVESIDMTGLNEGEWGICGSDTDNYLSTNPDYLYFDTNQFMAAYVCPDGDSCINISHLTEGVDALDLSFDAWFDCGWSNHAYAYIEISPVCPPDDVVADWSGPISLGFVYSDLLGVGLPSWLYDYYAVPPAEIGDGWIHYGPIDLWPYVTGLTEFSMRIVFYSDSYGFTFRGVLIDSFEITNLLFDDSVFPPETTDFMEEFDDLDDWCVESMHTGQYWEYVGDDTWCTEYIIETFPFVLPYEDALIWETEIMDCYEAYLTLESNHIFDGKPGSYGEIQISADGGSNWYILDRFEDDSGGWQSYSYDLTSWAGSAVLIRFLADNGHGGHETDLHWCVRDLLITGKQDHQGPMSSITMTGTMTDAGWYSSSVQATITATDLGGSGIKEIHYILDGQEKVVAGDIATFTISGNGAHNIEFWAVDNVGNVEPHHVVPTFRIDMGSAPSVAITAPEPGLYLFGNKILSLSKVFIIGAFTIEATASDAESGVYKVTFYLDDDVIADDTTTPYSAYCAQKHMGEGTIKVVAEDFAGNTAEDTLDITYYKFL
jgi:hypothetical protein